MIYIYLYLAAQILFTAVCVLCFAVLVIPYIKSFFK